MFYFCTEHQDILKLKVGKERCYCLQSHGVRDIRWLGEFYSLPYTAVKKILKKQDKNTTWKKPMIPMCVRVYARSKERNYHFQDHIYTSSEHQR